MESRASKTLSMYRFLSIILGILIVISLLTIPILAVILILPFEFCLSVVLGRYIYETKRR